MLELSYKKNCIEAGLDEAGRGCLADPVFAAAVILPSGFSDPMLKDSKLLTAAERKRLRIVIEQNALSFSVRSVDPNTIDRINILKASIKAMHLSIGALRIKPDHLVIDGNYFIPFRTIPYQTIVKGDNTYLNIAAASVLAKSYRDEWMSKLHKAYPYYNWLANKGYGTEAHIEAIRKYGLSPYHRRSFHVKALEQLKLFQDHNHE